MKVKTIQKLTIISQIRNSDYLTWLRINKNEYEKYKMKENRKIITNSTHWSFTYGVVANVMNCNIVASDFVLQSRYYIHFQTNALRKDMNSFIPAMDETVPVLFFYKDGFDIKSPTKVANLVGWGCWIHRLHLCLAGKTFPHNVCHVYDTKPSDGSAPTLELWRIWIYPFIAIALRITLTWSGSIW